MRKAGGWKAAWKRRWSRGDAVTESDRWREAVRGPGRGQRGSEGVGERYERGREGEGEIGLTGRLTETWMGANLCVCGARREERGREG